MRRVMARMAMVACIMLAWAGADTAAAEQAVTLLGTGDTQGHVGPCRICSSSQRGGLTRRATLVRDLRAGGPTLLLDAGNALFGAESLASEGRVIAVAYEVLGYDAINIGYRDFRLGKSATLAALADAMPAVSANLYHADDPERRLFDPFVVHERGGQRWAIVGLTDRPAALDAMPHLRGQLAGVTIRPPADALADVLPEAREAGDAVILLYYGSATSAHALLDALGDADAAAVHVVVAAGEAPPDGAPRDRPTIAWTRRNGTHLARVALSVAEADAVEVEQVEVPPTLEADAELAAALEPLTRFEADDADDAAAEREAGPERLPAGTAMEPGERYPLRAETTNRPLRMQVDAMAVHDEYAGRAAPAGMRWLVLDAGIESQMPIDLVLELDYQERLLIASLPRQLFLVVNGRTVRRVAWPEAEGHMPIEAILSEPGSAIRGKLIYVVPAEGIESLSLGYYHDQYAPLVLPLMDDEADDAADAAEPIVPAKRNIVMEVAVHGMEVLDRVGDRAAPAGMRFVRLDIRGRSLVRGEVDALALDRRADPQAKAEIPRVMEYLYGSQLIELLVDGEHGYTMEPALSTMDPEPPILPDTMAAGEAVFLVPEDVRSLELVLSYPQFKFPSIGDLGVPDPLRFMLEGEPFELGEREALARIADEPTPVEVLGAQWAERGDGDGVVLLLTVSVRNVSDEGGLFNVSSRFSSDVAGASREPRAAVLPGGVALREPMWLGAGERRTFQLVFDAADEADDARLSYGGVSRNETVTLNLGGAERAATAFALADEAAAERAGAADADADTDTDAEAGEVAEHGRASVDPPPRRTPAEPGEPADEGADDAQAEADAGPRSFAQAEPEPVDAPADAAADEPADAQADANDADADDDEARAAGLEGHAQMRVIAEDDMEAWTRERNREGVNLALHALGGRLETDSETRADRLGRLHNARLDSPQRIYPGAFQLKLAGREATSVNALAIAMTGWVDNLKLVVEAADGRGGYRHMASIDHADEEAPHVRVLEFDSIETDEIRLTVERSEERRSPRIQFHELMVFEGPLADKSESVVSNGGTNIAAIAHGGSVFHSVNLGNSIGRVLTSPDDGDFRLRMGRGQAGGDWLPPITLSFQANRAALVETVEVWPSMNVERHAGKPARVRLSASADEPFDGQAVVGEYNVAPGPGPWRLTLPEPVLARFLRVEVATAEEAETAVIGEIVVREGTEPGYESVLIRGDGVDWRDRAQPTLASLLGEEASQVRQTDGGDSPASAMAMPAGQWMGGTMDGPDQRHVYRFTLVHEPNEVSELQLHMVPFLRGRFRILDLEGNELETLDASQANTSLRHPLLLEPGDYLLEVTSAPTYLFMGFDVSGSMGRALPNTRDNLPRLTDDLPEGVYVALGSSKRSNGAFTLYSPYTRDGETLRKAILDDKMFSTGGTSDWYNFMGDMMAYADANTPPHAVGATVIVADAVGSGDHAKLWDRLRKSDQRLYTVGWGSATLRLDHVDHSTGWTAARGLFNTAWYRNGRYFEPQTDDALVATYEAILDDVQTPAEYATRIHVRERRPGQLVTVEPEGEDRPILFVFDASGSMMEAMGEQTRLDVAIDVMEQVVGRLPDHSQVGLRVYGHRFRAFGEEREQAATDSELLVPIGPLNRGAFMRAVRGIDARGATPLAHTIEQVASDLSGAERPRVIVLTDGVESFRRDPVASMRDLREQHPDMELAVVGFQIGEQVDRENLRGMADAGGAVYHNAMDGVTLVRSVEQAVNPVVRYELRERDGSVAASGRFGDQHELAEGVYELRAAVNEGEARLPVHVKAGRTRRLALDDLENATLHERRADAPRAEAADRGEVDDEGGQDGDDASPRFCTQCGERLQPGARFCPQCGEAVR